MLSIIVAKFSVIIAILSALFEAATHCLGQQKNEVVGSDLPKICIIALGKSLL